MITIINIKVIYAVHKLYSSSKFLFKYIIKSDITNTNVSYNQIYSYITILKEMEVYKIIRHL